MRDLEHQVHVASAGRRAARPRRVPVAEDADAFLARLEGSRRAGGVALGDLDAAALEALAVACARGGGAHELAVGEGLDLLARTGGDVRLGFSCVGDLARERLGVAPWQARRLRRNAVALRTRPLLREAVLSGEVSARKAEVVLAVATGADEAYWVERAKADTVRRLEAAVSCPEHVEEDWHLLRLALSRAQAEVVDVALAAAKVTLGPTAGLWRQLWAMAAEFLGTFSSEPLDAPGTPGPGPGPGPRAAQRREVAAAAAARAATVHSPRRPDGTVPAGALTPDVVRGREPAEGAEASGSRAMRAAAVDPYEVLDRLVRLVADRAAADERLGRACLMKRLGVARQLGWSCFEEWCVERLGLAPSTVYQRMALERRMVALPELREALRSRRLTYEQARLVARLTPASATPSDVAARIADAAGKPCIALVREVEAGERLQMCDAGELRAVVPEEVESLLAEAIRAARLHAGRPLTAGEALAEIARHFIATWGAEVLRLLKGVHPVILRDQGLCQIPGCSRPAGHVHHLWFRSGGGPLERWNELSSCIPHHLLGIHGGKVLATGRAPDGVTFVLGEREVAAARARA